MAVWAAHETEQLINLVRQNHTLYDPSSNDYRNRDVLKTLWNNIANEMNRSGRIFLSDMDCRDRWNSLRDGYRRFVKDEQISSNGSKPKKKKTWHWSEAMTFLKPYIQERASTSVIASVDTNSNRRQRSPGMAINVVSSSVLGTNVMSNNIVSNNIVSNNIVSNNIVTNNVSDSVVGNGIVSDDCSQDESNHRETPNDSVPDTKWHQTTSIEQTTTTTNSVPPIVISHHPMHHPQDPDEQFFRSLLPDVKVLSPRQRGIFKIQVQQLLQEMLYPKECGSLTSQQQPPSTSPQPSTSQIAYATYGNVYPSERWSSVPSSCGYSKPHSS